ncbi:hypothetical protein LG314_01145 [Agrococcus terreus]|uniref:uracil-DNA glycosylase family protein n=1 Tax=Agrococcus terreus TaxID=574649 RepID=UPI00384FF0BF
MLIGNQMRIDWRGESITTLRDLWPKAARAVIVGLNPAPKSVEAGHYYQGQSGQRQLSRLIDAGLFAPVAGLAHDDAAMQQGVGFTDLVKRPTRSEDGLSKSELDMGARRVIALLQQRATPLVICVFRHPVKYLIGVDGAPGFQHGVTPWGGRVFRMPGPFAAKEQGVETMQELARFLHR